MFGGICTRLLPHGGHKHPRGMQRGNKARVQLRHRTCAAPGGWDIGRA